MIVSRAFLKAKKDAVNKSAKARGIPCTLSIKDLEKLFEVDRCFYFGRALTESNVTFDRKDCNKGYTKDNVVLCTKEANNLKNQLFENPSSRLDANELQLFLARCGFKENN